MADVSTAKENVKRVFYVRFLNHPIYLDLIATRPEIRLDKLENDTPDAAAAPIISAAHAYQVSSARDELPAKFHVNKDLHRARAEPADRLDRRRRLRHRQREGLHRRGRAGRQPDRRQRRRGRAHVLGMMLMLSKQVVQVNNALRKGTMQDRNLYMGNDINGRTIGIVGLGNVGRRLAKLCTTLFDMTVLAYDPFLDEKTIAERDATKVSLDELLQRSDFVSINCPLDDTTRNMISTREFGLMQKHAYFITAARGFITDEKALEEALRSKQIAGAGLDVLVEGAAGDGPPAAAIRQRDREPAHRRRHQGGARQHGQVRGRAADPDARRQEPPRMVNPEVWPAYAKRFELGAFGNAPRGLRWPMIRNFMCFYVGQIELDNIGLTACRPTTGATPTNGCARCSLPSKMSRNHGRAEL